MNYRLGSLALEAGYHLLEFESLASTNDYALALEGNYNNHPVWVVAHEQFQGRGRMGRTWESVKGNLFASLRIDFPEEFRSRLAQLSYLVSIEVYDLVDELLSGLNKKIVIKWPNDLYVEGHKMSGILIESTLKRKTFCAAVIGVGLNVACSPEVKDYTTTFLSRYRNDVSLDEVFEMLSNRLSGALTRFMNQTLDFHQIRLAWLDRTCSLGHVLRVRNGTGHLEGSFKDIDEYGRLILEMPDGTLKTCSTGELETP